jgi:glycosyltransferase involved in cell wall biosynthesis
MKLSVLMPVYNERATLEEILRRVQAVPVDKEIVVVDNASTDGTREYLQELLKSGAAEAADGSGRLRVVLQPENGGKGSSVRRALELARGEYVIVQDADLEYDQQDYLKLLADIEKRRGRRAVFGTRLWPGSAVRAGQPRTAFYYGRVGLSLLFRLLYATALSDVATCYKLLPRAVAQELKLQSRGFDLDFEIAAKLRRCGVRIIEAPISYRPRTELEGKKIRAVRDGLRAAWALLKFRFMH